MTTTLDRHGEATVLLVDDDDANRVAMARALAQAGFGVVAAESGADAVDLARVQQPDVVVLDVFLPDGGGLGVARALRREYPRDEIPVLFVTGLSSPAVRDALSPAPILFKPFSRRDLVTRVRELVRQS